MKSSNSGWVRSIFTIIGLSLCLVFVCLTTAGAANPTVPSVTVSTDAAAPGSPPVIQIFKANPMTLETPTSAAVYTFKVKRATNLIITEAGNEIRNISNPTGAALSGIATGLPASAIPADDSGKFKAVLMASNAAGAVKAELTLSFSDKLLASGQPAETEGADNETDSRSPKWLDQYFSPFGPARSSQSGTEPQFFDCPSDCDHCLTPEDAKSQGMGERCSAERCYYSPDNQQNWYCFKPAPGWCCNNLNVSQATKDECNQMGGSWFLNQSEAQERCQPLGYCCQNGNITSLTRSQCAQVGGSYWSTNQNEAIQACQPIGWCCRDGQVYSTTRAQCAQVGGSYWSTNQAEAMRACQPVLCWCCSGGKAYQTTQAQCAQSGGTCYSTQSQADAACRQAAMCWCCSGGKVSYTTQAACAQSGGTCYSTESQADAGCRLKTPYLR